MSVNLSVEKYVNGRELDRRGAKKTPEAMKLSCSLRLMRAARNRVTALINACCLSTAALFPFSPFCAIQGDAISDYWMKWMKES